MSAAASATVFVIGQLALEAAKAYAQAKADNAAALLGDAERIAALDKELADATAGGIAALDRLDADLGIAPPPPSAQP